MAKILTSKMSLLAIGFFTVGSGNALAEQVAALAGCGNPNYNGDVGPYEYLHSYDRQHHLPVVERHHFNRDVEFLVKGQTSAYIMTDLDYVLRAFPNHHRALASLLRYAPSRLPQEKQYFPTECYFQRAVSFSPNDATAFLLYGVYLASNEKKMSEAEDKYLAALKLQPNYAEAHYNLGLLYVKRKELELALDSAKKAYVLGFPLQGLKHQLQRAGVWSDE